MQLDFSEKWSLMSFVGVRILNEMCIRDSIHSYDRKEVWTMSLTNINCGVVGTEPSILKWRICLEFYIKVVKGRINRFWNILWPTTISSKKCCIFIITITDLKETNGTLEIVSLFFPKEKWSLSLYEMKNSYLNIIKEAIWCWLNVEV